MAAMCEVGEMLSARTDVGPDVASLFAAFTERWDGRGEPGGLAGEQMPLPLRIMHVARDATFQRLLGGQEHAERVMAERAGGAFAPAVVPARLLTLNSAVGLHRGLRPTRWGIAGPALLGLSGAALLLAAAIPLRQDAAGEVYDPGGHIVVGTALFAASAVGLVVLSRWMAADPAWSSLARWTLAAGSPASWRSS